MASAAMGETSSRIVLDYPSRVTGGAEWLFVRLANALAANGRRVAVIDYPDGFLAQHVDSAVELIALRGDRIALGDSVVIVPLSHHRLLRHLETDARTRVLLWSIHPSHATSLLPRGQRGLARRTRPATVAALLHPVGLQQLRRHLRKLGRANALAFMDTPNLDAFNALYPTPGLDDRTIPVPIASPEPRAPRTPGSLLRFSWIGRLSGEKVPALLRVLADLEALRLSPAPIFEVIGAGPDADRVELAASGAAHLRVSLLGEVAADAFPDALSGTDLVFAHGTSLLEAARLGVPAVVTDPSNVAVGGNLPYPYLDELPGFGLGRVLTDHSPPTAGQPMSRIVADLRNPSVYAQMVQRQVDHVTARHSLERSLFRLEEAADRSTATVRDSRALDRVFLVWRCAMRAMRAMRILRPSREVRANQTPRCQGS